MQFSLFKKSESDDEEKKIGHYHHYRYGHKSLELAPNLAWLAHDGATRNWRTEAQDKVSMHITEEKEFFWPNASGGILVSIHHHIYPPSAAVQDPKIEAEKEERNFRGPRSA